MPFAPAFPILTLPPDRIQESRAREPRAPLRLLEEDG